MVLDLKLQTETWMKAVKAKEEKNEEMKRIATEAENTARHVLTFMPRFICYVSTGFILCSGPNSGIFPGKTLEKSREYGVCGGKMSFRSFSGS